MKVKKYNPDIIRWAIERAELDKDELKERKRFKNLQAWLSLKDYPTLKQLEDLSKALYIPFGYFFFDKIPNQKIEFSFFRTLKGEMQKVSVHLYDTIQIIESRQLWLSEYLQNQGEDTLDFVGKYNHSDKPNVKEIVEDIRKTLSLSAVDLMNLKDASLAIRYLTDKIESVRIMVSFNGVVGNNTKRKLSVEEFRGFVLVDKYVPFMFINNNDAPRAQLFSMAHELAHIWLGESAGFDYYNFMPYNNPIEILCDEIAAEFLVEESFFRECWQEGKNTRDISQQFNVSEIVIIRKALSLKLIDKEEFFNRYNVLMNTPGKERKKRTAGGDYYRTAPKRISRSFINYVGRALNQDRLLYRDAYRLLGCKKTETLYKMLSSC